MNAELRHRAKWGWREIPRQPVSLPYVPGMADGTLYRLKPVDLTTDSRGEPTRLAMIRARMARLAHRRHAQAPVGSKEGQKWTEAEDAALLEARATGMDFKDMVAAFDRSEMSCRMRWRRLKKGGR